VVGEYHLARRDGQVLADGERGAVHLARAALVVGQVIEEVAAAGQQAPAGRIERPLERGRVGQQEVGRAQRVEQEAGRDPGLGVGDLVTAPQFEQLVGELPGGQVVLQQGGEPRVVRPGRVGEPLVPARGDRWLGRCPGHPGQGEPGDPRHAGAQPEAGRADLDRVLHGPVEHGQHGPGEAGHVQLGDEVALRAQGRGRVLPQLRSGVCVSHEPHLPARDSSWFP
jgi:hypothetical protein